MATKREKKPVKPEVDPHRPSAWGVRPLFRLQLRRGEGYPLIDVLSITTIPNANKSFTEKFKKSKPVTGPHEPTMYHHHEMWICLGFHAETQSWGYFTVEDVEELHDMQFYSYEVVS